MEKLRPERGLALPEKSRIFARLLSDAQRVVNYLEIYSGEKQGFQIHVEPRRKHCKTERKDVSPGGEKKYCTLLKKDQTGGEKCLTGLSEHGKTYRGDKRLANAL